MQMPKFLPRSRRSRAGGFSLIEISIVLIIAGLALGAGLAVLGPQLKERNYTRTQEQLQRTADAIVAFAVGNGRLPCPATPTSNGHESWCVAPTGACVESTSTAALLSGRGRCAAGVTVPVQQGTVPARSLGLPEQSPAGTLVDAWAGTITYAVTPVSVTVSLNTATWTYPQGGSCTAALPCHPWTQPGALRSAYFDHAATPNWTTSFTVTASTICGTSAGITTSGCGTAPLVGTAVFVLLSRGANWGAASPPGETANADGDRVFVLRPRATNADPPSPAYFDDLLVWVTPSALLQRMIDSGVARP